MGMVIEAIQESHPQRKHPRATNLAKEENWAFYLYEGISVERHLKDLTAVQSVFESQSRLDNENQVHLDPSLANQPASPANLNQLIFKARSTEARIASIQSSTKHNVHCNLMLSLTEDLSKRIDGYNLLMEQLLERLPYANETYTQLTKIAEHYAQPVLDEVDQAINDQASYLKPLENWLVANKATFEKEEESRAAYNKALEEFHAANDWLSMDIAVGKLQLARPESTKEIKGLHVLLEAARDLLEPTPINLQNASKLLEGHRKVELTALLQELTLPVERLLEKSMEQAQLAIALEEDVKKATKLKHEILEEENTVNLEKLEKKFDFLYSSYSEIAETHFKESLELKRAR